jgi:hypothetical protein
MNKFQILIFYFKDLTKKILYAPSLKSEKSINTQNPQYLNPNEVPAVHMLT